LLHMQLLANGSIPDNLAPSELTKTHNIKNLCRNIHIGTTLVIIAGLLLSVWYLFQGYQKSNQIDTIATKTERQLKQYELVADHFPVTPIPGSDLKAAVEIAQTINNQTPRQLMQVISTALEGAPEIAINRIRWVQSNEVDLTEVSGGEIKQASNNGQAATANVAQLVQIGFINAEIRQFKGDYRAALASASNFANHLRDNPLVSQVKILQEPVNVSSLANLQGSTRDEGTTQRTPAIFKLKVVLKATDEESTL